MQSSEILDSSNGCSTKPRLRNDASKSGAPPVTTGEVYTYLGTVVSHRTSASSSALAASKAGLDSPQSTDTSRLTSILLALGARLSHGPKVGRSIDLAWREHHHLKDGTHILLRLIRPDDKDLLARGLSRMSPESRYFRFFSAKDRLTDSELRYLTEIDGENHLAIGAATVVAAEEVSEGLGVARFIRFRDEPSVAEAAVTVIDAAQGKGLGKVLLARLVLAAQEREIQRFRCDFLARNRGMKALVDVFADVSYEVEAGVIRAEFPLEGPEGLFRALAGAARKETIMSPGSGEWSIVSGEMTTE